MIALLHLHLLHPTVGNGSPSPAAGCAGRMETGNNHRLPDGSGFCCVHGTAFWARNPTPGVIYTPPSRWLARCLNLAVWQGCAAGYTGEPGQEWLGVGCFIAVSVTAQSGTGGLDSVPAWAAWSWDRVTGPAAPPMLSHGHMQGHFASPVSPVDPQSR